MAPHAERGACRGPAAARTVDVVPAKIVKRVTPLAPSGISRKTTGYVVVSYNIGTNGRVTDVEVVESQPQGVFDDSARERRAQMGLRAAQGKRRGGGLAGQGAAWYSTPTSN